MTKPTLHIWPVQLEDRWSTDEVEVQTRYHNGRDDSYDYWDIDTLFTIISSGTVRFAYQDIIMHARPDAPLADWFWA